MKSVTTITLATTLLGSIANKALADEITLSQCPEPVAQAIKSHRGLNRIDDIRQVRTANRIQYLAEFELPGERERKLHFSEDGILLKVIEDVRQSELPRKVRMALVPFLAGASRYEDAERVRAEGKTEYHIEIDLPDDVDLHLVMDEDGGILRRREEADF